MNTRIKKTRVKRWRAPKPVPPPKPPRPKRSTLKNIYKDLISSDSDQRLEGLKKAMHWYEELQAYLAYNSELTLNQKKAKAAAERHRLIGLNFDKTKTKESQYILAIKEYEKLGKKYNPPKIGVFISKYSHVRSKLEQRKNRLTRKFGEFLELVDNAVKPVNYDGTRIQLRVNKISSEYRVDSEGNITFDRKFLDAAKATSRSHGLLPGLNYLWDALTEAAAVRMEQDVEGHRTGRYVIHGSKRYQAMKTMMHNLLVYQNSDKNPKRLIRRHKLVSVRGNAAA